MKKTQKSVFLRYEFTNESGQPEGGDIFEFPSNREPIAMATDILKVANLDGVSVHITVGPNKAFHGLLKNFGMSSAQIEAERVPMESLKKAPPKKKKPAKKKKK